MWAVIKKELKQYFCTPIGYVFIGIFLIAFSVSFYFTVIGYGNVNYEYIFYSTPTIFVLAFAPAFGFGDPLHSETGLYYGSNLFIVIGTLIALIALCVKYVYNHNDKLLRQSLLTLVAFLIIAIGGFGFSQVWDINSGAATEYLEVFISVGLMSWALLVNSRIKLSQPAQKNNQQLADSRV